MASIETGGQAFPDGYDDGMTLLDYFAAKAMAAEIAAGGGGVPVSDAMHYDKLAVRSYTAAIAMLAERERLGL